MRILFVEDNAGFAGDLEPALREIVHVGEIITVRDKETAVAKLTDELVDLVILDLSIPPNPTVDTPDPEHGQALFHEAQSLRPGTPVFILTGSEVDKFSRGLAKFGNQVRLWGDGTQIETVSFFLKEEVNELLARVATLAELFSGMGAVAINTRGKELGLSTVQSRMLKTYAHFAGGIACDVSLLSGGLSDAKVVKAAAYDRARKRQSLCAGKLGSRKVISSEIAAYDNYANKLGVGACPNVFYSIEDGVGDNGAIFYTLTDDDTASFFERLAENPGLGSTVIEQVRNALLRWSEAATADLTQIGAIRKRMVEDEDATSLRQEFGLEQLVDLERQPVQISQSVIHGDLHCGNVLVKSNGDCVLIDFGDAGPGFTGLDPVALELSLIFHPDAKKLGLRDDIIGGLEQWPDVDAFVGDSPLKPMIAACREWTHDVAGGDQAVLACAFAFGFRQLKYDTVSAEVTLNFVRSLSNRLLALR